MKYILLIGQFSFFDFPNFGEMCNSTLQAIGQRQSYVTSKQNPL